MTADGQVLDEEICRELLSLPARADGHEEAQNTQERMEKDDKNPFVNSVPFRGQLDEIRNAEIKYLDVQIREVKKASKDAAALAEKLEWQKKVKSLESQRKEKRRR